MVQLLTRILLGSQSQEQLELHGNRDLSASSLSLRSGCVLLLRKPGSVGSFIRCLLNASTEPSSGQETLHVTCVQHLGDLQRVSRPHDRLLDSGLYWDRPISRDKRHSGRVDHSFDPSYDHFQWRILGLSVHQSCLFVHQGLLHRKKAQETWQKEEEGSWLRKKKRIHSDEQSSKPSSKLRSKKHCAS